MNDSSEMTCIFEEVSRQEKRNREPEMQVVMREVARLYRGEARQGFITIVEDYPGSTCSLAVFLDEYGSVTCAPIDPLAISFYQYSPTLEEDAARRTSNPLLRDNLLICGPLKLVDSAADASSEISKNQLIAIQSLIGNNSTWWPITDYSEDELLGVFEGLELNVIYWNDCPIGIVHMDYSGLETSGAVKIVFIGLDPAVQGQGLGRELLHKVMSDAIDRGARTIYLDTVAHRDIRTKTSQVDIGKSLHNPSAHDVYLKAGFKITGVKLIDPSNKHQLQEEALEVNQLNGPLEYVMSDLTPLREAVYAAFHSSPGKRLHE